ncbi:unnamed protein product [Closterium sp. NIES-54]
MRSLRTAHELKDAVVPCYSSPATAALGCLLLPYPFPMLCDAIICIHVWTTISPSNPTVLTIDLLEQHLLAAETSVVAVGAARGTLRTPFFEGCSPSPLAPSSASALLSTSLVLRTSGLLLLVRSAAAARARVAGVVAVAAGVVAGAAVEVVEAVEVVAVVGVVAGVGGFGGDGGGSGWSDGSGSGGSGGGRTTAHGGGFGGGQRQRPQRRSETASPLTLVPHAVSCVEGRQRTAPHSSSFPPTTAPLHTLHIDQNGIAERRIGLVMEVASTSVIHAVAPHFLWPFAVLYAAHQLNLWPRVSLPETSPFLHWMGKVGDMSTNKLSARAIPCSAPFYRLFPYRSAPPLPPALFLAPGPPPVDPLPPEGPAPSGVSQVDPLLGAVPVEVAGDLGAARGAASRGVGLGGEESGGAESEGAGSSGAEPGGAEPEGTELASVETGGAKPRGFEPRGAESEGAESEGSEPQVAASSGGPAGVSLRVCSRPEPLSPQQLREWLVRCARLRGGAAGARATRDYGARGARVTTRAGGTGGAAGAGPGGARTMGTGAARTGGVEGAGAGNPTEPGAAGVGGARAGGTDAGGAGAGGAGDYGAGAGGTSAGGSGAGGAGAFDPRAGGAGAEATGGTSAGGTVRLRPYFVPLLQQVLGVPSSTALTLPILCPPADHSQPPLQPASPLLAPSPYFEQTSGLTERRVVRRAECAECDCYQCVPHDPSIEAAALGASESSLPGTALAEALHTFTLDSGASHCFFGDGNTFTPLPAPVPIKLADHSGGPLVARSSTVLPCPAVPSGSLSGLHLPSFSTNLVSTAAFEDSMVTTTTPWGSITLLLSPPVAPDSPLAPSPWSPLPATPAWHALPPPCLWSSPGHCLPSRPHLPRPAFLALRGGSARLRTPPPFCWCNPSACIRLVVRVFMEVSRTSMIHAAAPHFLWPFAVRYAAHQLNLWPYVSLPETSPTLSWTGEVGDASVFRVWDSRAFVRDSSADKLSARAIPSLVPFYHLFPYRSAPPPLPPLFLAPGPPLGDPLPPQGPASSGVSHVDPLPGTTPVEVAGDSSAARGAASGGVEPGCAEPGGVEPGGAESEGAESGGAEPWGTASSGDPGAGGAGVAAGAGGTRGTAATGPRAGGTGVGGTGAGGAGAVDPGAGGTVRPQSYFVPLLQQPSSPLPSPSPYTDQTGGLTERREPESRPFLPVHTARRVPCSRPLVPGTHAMTLRPSSVPLRVPLPPPLESSLPSVPDPESDHAHAANLTVSRLLATVVTDPSFESTAASALIAELLDFAAPCRLDYTTALVAESESVSPPSIGGECALCTDVLEDRQEEFECLAAAVPRFASMQLAPEGDPDAPNIPTPRSYAEAITVDGMWIFRVKRPPGSPPAFKAHYVARGFTFLQGGLRKEIWLRRPPGFTGSFPAITQWSLRRLVYGLRQSPREWHDTLRTTLAALRFAPSTADLSLFLRTDTSLPPFYVLIYVDDLVFATADTEALTLVKSELQKRHTFTDVGKLHSYPGLQITRDRARRTINLTQSHMVHLDDYYLCVPPDPGIEAAALDARDSSHPGTAPAEALHTFTLDSGASLCFFRDSTTLTPLPAPVPVRLADSSGGPVLAHSSTVLLCPASVSSSASGSVRTFLSCVCTLTNVQNGIAERRIGLVMEVARTSMIHTAAPHFLWSFAVRYAAHQLNLWPRVSLPETSPTLRWTGKVGDASVFRVWGSHAFVRDRSTDKLSARAIPCGPAPSSVSHVGPLLGTVPVEVAVASGAARGAASRGATSGSAEPARAEPGGAESEGAGSGGVEPAGAEPGGAEPEGAEPGGAESEGAESGGADSRGTASSGGLVGASPKVSPRTEPLSLEQLREWFARRTRLRNGATGDGDSAAGGTGAGGAGATSLGGAGVPAGAGGPGGARAANPGGARTRGTGAAGAGGAGGAGAGDPGAGGAGAGDTGAVDPRAQGTGVAGAGGVGGAGAGGAGAGGTGARGTGAGSAGAGGAGAGNPGAGGARAVDPGAGGAGAGGATSGCTGVGGTVQRRSFFLPLPPSAVPPPDSVLRQVLSLLSSTGLTPSLLSPPPCQSQPQLQPDSPLPATSPYAEQTDSFTERLARYSSPTTAALGRLILPYLFPELSAFPTVEDLITHLHTSDARYRAALEAEFLDKNPPPVYITLYFIVTRLPDSLCAVRDRFLALDPTRLTVDLLEKHLLAAKTSIVAVGAACGTPTLAPSYASATAVDILVGVVVVEAMEAVQVAKVAVGVVEGVGDSVAAVVAAVGVVVAVVAVVGVVAAAVVVVGVEFFLDELCIEAAALGASESALPSTAPAEALHTFTLDSGASRCFFCDSTTLTPLPAPVPPIVTITPLRVADPSGGPVLARSSTVLQCPAVPSGSLSGLQLPSFSTNLVSTAALQDAMVTATTPWGSACVDLPVYTDGPVPSTRIIALRPSSVPLRVPLPSPPASSHADGLDPESDLVRAPSPTVTCLLATVVTNPSFESTVASAVVVELVDFVVTCRLDYPARLVAESESDCPPSIRGECALETDVLEHKQRHFECLAAAVPHPVALLLAPEGDPGAPDIPTPRSYAEAITGPYSSQSQTAMDAEMAS